MESFLLNNSDMEFMKYLRACAICKSYLPPTNWLCSLCWKVMEREYLSSGNVYRTEKQLPHLRLLDWHEDNHQLMKLFINSLKQGGPNFIFKRLALEMFSHFVHQNLWNKKIIPLFIPAPSRKKGEQDHAFLLAKALCFYFGGDCKNILQRTKTNEFQKSKSRRKRALIEIHSSNFITTNRPIVFVDDVLTTGSTARASFRALNQPKNFFVFSLIWRRPKQKQEFLSSKLFRDSQKTADSFFYLKK